MWISVRKIIDIKWIEPQGLVTLAYGLMYKKIKPR